jgi:hypothetical protein
MPCAECQRDVPIENRDTGLCATCNKDARDASNLYPIARQMFLEMCIRNEVVCPITGVSITMESDIHHKMGRIGYADDKKRAEGIPLLIDPDYFLAVSRTGHQWIEAPQNRKWAEKLGYILSRLAKNGEEENKD